MARTRHAPQSKLEAIKYMIVDLVRNSQRVFSFLSHFVLLFWKIYKHRNYRFISSYVGYYIAFLLVFVNYIYFLVQTPNIVLNDQQPVHSPDIRLGSTVNLKDYNFVIDHPASVEADQFFRRFSDHFKAVCQLDQLIFFNRQKPNAPKYQTLKKQFGQKLLGRLIVEHRDQQQTNFTIEIDNYQLKIDYWNDFPFATDRFNLFNFEFGLNKSHFIEIQNCVLQSMLRVHQLEDVVRFQIDDFNKEIDVKVSFFYFLPLIITIGWLPNCLSITAEKLKETNTNLKRLYRICGLDALTYHLSYTAYLFVSLIVQTVLFIIVLQIINLPFYFRIVPNTDEATRKTFPVKFHRTLINSRVFFNVMFCYNLAVSLNAQLFSLLYRSRTHFCISFAIYTFFTLLPFNILTTHLQVPFQAFADYLQPAISRKFLIIYSTFLLCPSAALTYSLRQIEDMSRIENEWQSGDMSKLQTFESLSFHHITINDVLLIFLTYSLLSCLLIATNELGLRGFFGKLLLLDLFRWNLNSFYELQITDHPERPVLLRMVDFSSARPNCNCSVNNEEHQNCVNNLKKLNLQAKANELIVILSNKYKAKEYLFSCLIGETTVRSGELYLDGYRPHAFLKPLFVNCFPTSSTGVCFEEDLFDNPLSLEENLSIYSRLKGSQFVADISDLMLILHLLKLKDVKRVPVNVLSKSVKRKLAVAVALLGSQRILILNEPTKGADMEDCKLIWETLVKLKHDKLIVVLTTNSRLNFHSYADHLYVLNNCELFHAGSLHQLMNATHSGILLVFRKLNNRYSVEQLEELLDTFFGENEFALVCSNNNRLVWYSFNISLIHLCNEFRDEFDQIGDEMNLRLERIRVSRMKLNLNANHQKPEPVAYEQNPNIFFIGQTRVPKRRPEEPTITYDPSNWMRELLYCLRINLCSLEVVLFDLINLVLIFLLVFYLLNVFELFNFFHGVDEPVKSTDHRSMPSAWQLTDDLNDSLCRLNDSLAEQSGRQEPLVGRAADEEGSNTESLKALDFSSSAVMENLLVYVIETKRESFSLSNHRLNFTTQELVDFLNVSLSRELNTHQFLCLWMYDPFKLAHEHQFNLALIERHLGGILKLDYNVKLNSLVAELDHNSHFPYLLLQVLDLLTNFLINQAVATEQAYNTKRERRSLTGDLTDNSTGRSIGNSANNLIENSTDNSVGDSVPSNNLTEAGRQLHSKNSNGDPPKPAGRRFKVNLQFNENKGLRFLYKNLISRIGNFFLLTCIVFGSSILLNQNLIFYFRRRNSIIGHVKRMKRVPSAIYWTGNLIADQTTGMLSWLGVLAIVLLLNSISPSVISFMEFSIGGFESNGLIKLKIITNDNPHYQ